MFASPMLFIDSCHGIPVELLLHIPPKAILCQDFLSSHGFRCTNRLPAQDTLATF